MLLPAPATSNAQVEQQSGRSVGCRELPEGTKKRQSKQQLQRQNGLEQGVQKHTLNLHVFFNSCFAHISSVCCKCFNMPSKSKANHSKLLRVPDGLRMPETCSAVTNNRPPLFSRFSVPHQLCQNHPPE